LNAISSPFGEDLKKIPQRTRHNITAIGTLSFASLKKAKTGKYPFNEWGIYVSYDGCYYHYKL